MARAQKTRGSASQLLFRDESNNTQPIQYVQVKSGSVLGRIVKFDRILNTEYIWILKIHRIPNTEYIQFLKIERIRILNSAIRN